MGAWPAGRGHLGGSPRLKPFLFTAVPHSPAVSCRPREPLQGSSWLGALGFPGLAGGSMGSFLHTSREPPQVSSRLLFQSSLVLHQHVMEITSLTGMARGHPPWACRLRPTHGWAGRTSLRGRWWLLRHDLSNFIKSCTRRKELFSSAPSSFICTRTGTPMQRPAPQRKLDLFCMVERLASRPSRRRKGV